MKAVIFDLGNVLINYDHKLTMEAVANISQLPTSGLNELFAEVSHECGIGDMGVHDLHAYLIERAGTIDDFDRFLDALCAGQSRIEPALSYAMELQRREAVTVAVISNTNEGHVLWLDQYVPELNEFDLVMMSNEVRLAKPDPAIFELALELLDLQPDQAIFVDDLAANVDAARLYGLGGIVHSDWQQTLPQLEAWLVAVQA